MKRILKNISSKNTIQLEVRNFTLTDNELNIDGYVANDSELKLLQSHLMNMSASGKVNNSRVNLPTIAGKVSFSYNLNVDRGIEKVKK